MKQLIVKFKKLSPLHIGTGRENYDFSANVLQSDVISSALASIYATQIDSNGVEKFINSFIVSSAFPFIDDIFFLPAPNAKLNINVDNEEEHLYRKDLKKIKYIESTIWQSLVDGTTLTIERSQLQGSFLISKGFLNFKSPYKSQVNERVSVPREENENASPFFFDWTYFRDNAGLYCILSCEGDNVNIIKELFSILSDNGIGTDRNIGGGKFEVEFIDIDILPTIQNPTSSMILSMYIPTKNELSGIDLEKSKYDLHLRGGYISGSEYEQFRHLRKKSIYMFGPGSVFATTQTLSGKVVDLRPMWNDDTLHNVYRSGKPFVVPVKL